MRKRMRDLSVELSSGGEVLIGQTEDGESSYISVPVEQVGTLCAWLQAVANENGKPARDLYECPPAMPGPETCPPLPVLRRRKQP